MVHPPHRQITFLIFTGAVFYFLFVSWLCTGHYEAVRTQMNDLGNVDHAVWKASRGDWGMSSENYDEAGSVSRFAIHANVLYWLIAPLYWIWSSPEVLLLLTTLACALGGVGIFFFARDRLGDAKWALVPAFAYWASPMVHDANLFDFKIITLAAAFIIWMAWAFDTGRLRTAWVLFALALACQEDVAPVLFMYGLGECLTRDRKRGLWMMAISAAYLVVLYFWVVPYFSGGAYRGTPDNRYLWLKTAWPTEVIAMAMQPERLRLVFYFLLSGAIVAWRGWRYLLLVVTPLLGGLLSKYVGTSRITGSYYWVICEACIVMACVAACSGRSRRPLIYLGTATLLLSLILSPLPHGMFASWKDFREVPESAAIYDIRRLVPPEAAVSAQNNVATHLAHREFITTYPAKKDRADYVLLHLRYTGSFTGLNSKGGAMILGMQPWEAAVAVKNYIHSDRWGLIAYQSGYYLFGRGKPSVRTVEDLEKIYAYDVGVLKYEFTRYSDYAYVMKFLNGRFNWGELSQFLKSGFRAPAPTAKSST